ncbi:MAG TPA: EVE domain-containing protein [Xanthobacteraceae bacterium]|nr:EVE domain-containing protein [Xanthobacteraceae bacterium]
MDERLARTIANISTLEGLAQFERNAERLKALNDEVRAAVDTRTAELGRELVAKRTGLLVTDLTPAEEKIIQAVSAYVGIKRRMGRNANRTFMQLENRGLIDSAEVSVAKAKPTEGYETLNAENLSDLSYEKIIIDHPDEFSDRALWYARRTLGLPNISEKPPARGSTPVQRRTEELIDWLRSRAAQSGGAIPPFSNVEAAAAIGLGDMHQYGRVHGNIQSRLDFACYQAGLPPLGLTAEAPFDEAWGNPDGRPWNFPISSMREAATSRRWSARDFDRILARTRALPGQAHLSWKAELADNGEEVRAWANGEAWADEDSAPTQTDQGSPAGARNPDWTREEHILALDLYLRLRGTSYGETTPEVIALSETLRALATIRGMSGGPTFRNPNGVSMKMMNFRRVDPEYTADGRVGLDRGSGVEASVWSEFAVDRPALARAVEAIMASIDEAEHLATGADRYWVLVCNPKKWAIDQFLADGAQEDSWGIRPSDAKFFAPGQLALVRVGVDSRSAAERDGAAPLEAGIYALCEIDSEAFPGSGANDAYWADGVAREPGWPTVRIRYVRTYGSNPLTIERLRREHPGLSRLLLKGFQGASFPIGRDDFQTIMSLLGEDLDEMPSLPTDVATSLQALANLEARFSNASPEVKTRVSKCVERGPIGAAVKRVNGYRCQLCDAIGMNAIGFLKKDGTPYVEAHHVMPVSTKRAGVLSSSNIMTLCANHHRQLHYGDVVIKIGDSSFELGMDGQFLVIPKIALTVSPTETLAA